MIEGFSPERFSLRRHTFGKILFLLNAFLVLSGGANAQSYPAPWPASGAWITYTKLSSPVSDLATSGGDASDGGTGVNPNSLDVFNGTSGNLPSVYFYFDATNQAVFFRMRLVGNPTASGGGGVLQNGTWNALFDTDGD